MQNWIGGKLGNTVEKGCVHAIATIHSMGHEQKWLLLSDEPPRNEVEAFLVSFRVCVSRGRKYRILERMCQSARNIKKKSLLFVQEYNSWSKLGRTVFIKVPDTYNSGGDCFVTEMLGVKLTKRAFQGCQ